MPLVDNTEFTSLSRQNYVVNAYFQVFLFVCGVLLSILITVTMFHQRVSYGSSGFPGVGH